MAEIAKIRGYDIRDKKLADATSQNTVAQTDAIEMKTTNGDQVYITRDSFVQAMASVLNSNSQSTINQLFGADSSGNYAAINMSNLASLVGGLPVSTDSNTPGTYKAFIPGSGLLVSFSCAQGPCIQLKYTYINGDVYIRAYQYIGGMWYAWTKIN